MNNSLIEVMNSEFEKVEVSKNFTQPTEIFQKFLDNLKNTSGDQQKVIDNNIKFQKAFIAYNQAMVDMMEAVNDNAKLIKTK